MFLLQTFEGLWPLLVPITSVICGLFGFFHTYFLTAA